MYWVTGGAVVVVLALAAIGYYGVRALRAAKRLLREVGVSSGRLIEAFAPTKRALGEAQAALAARGTKHSDH
jgi:hypothetical protein